MQEAVPGDGGSWDSELVAAAVGADRLGRWTWNPQSGTVRWSDVLCRMLGWEPGTVTPSFARWADCVHPDDLPRIQAELSQARRVPGVYRLEYRIRARHHADQDMSGDWRWLRSVSRARTDDAGATTLDGLCFDITAAREQAAENARLQEAVAHERTFLESVLQQLPAGAVVVEAPSGRVLLTNRALQARTGPIDPASGRESWGRFAAFHPDGRPYTADEYRWPGR